MRLVLRPPHGVAGTPQPERGVAQALPPVREAVVDHRDGEGCGVVRGSRRAARCGAAGELGGDDRPRGVVVAPGQVEAAQARAVARLDERADASAVVVEDDREMRDVGSEPRQMPTG
ncbi:hypothetical protein DCE93_04295 [Agromyces badenianii]|uniref:Uncharacterized protein n=1 Tax=Agromyces badenianii TaxID=2080742 RepID=A0A2S0WUG8_9MICO|nr:hypothetical protein DCE93_04295 [Agromyces badenianii]